MRQWKLSVILDTSSMMTFYFAVSIKMSEGGSERKKCWMFSFTGEWNTNSWTAFANFLTENEAKSSMPAFPKFSIIHSSAILKKSSIGVAKRCKCVIYKLEKPPSRNKSYHRIRDQKPQKILETWSRRMIHQNQTNYCNFPLLWVLTNGLLFLSLSI